jgi:hypothetical protein
VGRGGYASTDSILYELDEIPSVITQKLLDDIQMDILKVTVNLSSVHLDFRFDFMRRNRFWASAARYFFWRIVYVNQNQAETVDRLAQDYGKILGFEK